jgi:hypothetical protein
MLSSGEGEKAPVSQWFQIPSLDPSLTINVRWNYRYGTFEGKVFQDASSPQERPARVLYEFGTIPLQPWFYLGDLFNMLLRKGYISKVEDNDPIYEKLLEVRDSECL